MDQHPLARLREALLSSFDHGQLLALCAGLDLDDDGLEDESREALAVNLIGCAARRGRVSDLIVLAREAQPGAIWDEMEIPREIRATITFRHQLPAQIQGFVGREDEIQRVIELLDAKPAGAVIYGKGGVGKTSLAVHLAHRIAGRYPDAHIVIQMGGSAGRPLSRAAAAERVVHAFEPERRLPGDEEEVLRLYASALTGQRALILLDDAASADQISSLVPPVGSTLLITSRQPLSLPGLGLAHVGALSVDQAREVLLHTMGRDADAHELDRITALCGRLPLALRISGGLVAVHPDWSTVFLARELTEERVDLARLRFEDAEVEAALALGAGQMVLRSPELAARWQMLSLFPAAFDLIAAAAVWGVKDQEALDGLSGLVARGLVLHDPRTGLYDLHELVRPAAADPFSYEVAGVDSDGEPLQRLVQRAQERVGWDPERRRMARAATRHAKHYLAVGALANDRYQEGGEYALEGLRMFDAAWPHLQEARRRLMLRKDKDSVRWLSDFARRTAPLLGLRLAPRQRIPLLEGSVAAAIEIGDRRAQASHLGNLGLAYTDMGEPQRAIAYHRQALAIDGRLRDRGAEGAQLSCLGNAYLRLGESEQAIGCHEKARDIHNVMGDKRAEASNLTALAIAHKRLGDARQAITYYDRALSIARELGDRRAEGAHLGNLGQGYRQLGETERAIEYFEQALAIARRINDPAGESAALGNLGLAYGSLGEAQRAQACHRQALAIARQTGELREQEIHLGNLGMACAVLGQRERAIAYFQEALALSRQLGDRRGEANLSWSLGLLVEWTDPARAAQLMRLRVEVSQEAGDPNAEALKERLLDVQGRAQSRQRDRRARRHN